MPAEPLNRPIRVLLLDSAWPYDTSVNLLRLNVLHQLMRELHLADEKQTAGLFEAFDLIVARDSPFTRHFLSELNGFARFARSENLWPPQIGPTPNYVFEEVGDEQFTGYTVPHRGQFDRLP